MSRPARLHAREAAAVREEAAGLEALRVLRERPPTHRRRLHYRTVRSPSLVFSSRLNLGTGVILGFELGFKI